MPLQDQPIGAIHPHRPLQPQKEHRGVNEYFRDDLRGHTGVGGTLPLTEAPVAAVPAGKVELASARPRVHRDGLTDNKAVGDELADRLAGVGIADLSHLVGVDPDLVLAAADDRRGQALLGAEVDPKSSILASVYGLVL